MPQRKPRRLVALGAAALLLALVLYASTFVISYADLFQVQDPLLASDVARLAPARIARLEHVREVEQLRAVLRDARQRGLKVSVAGSRHSQGGHTYTAGGVRLDMRTFHRILAIDSAAPPSAPTVTVESGATWDEVQRAIAPHGLAVKVMQSSNIFTVGGTLSANAHGRDLDKTSVVETVRSIRVLTADGQIVEASRDKNPELFRLVIGGYGMFGIILDAELDLVDDEVYEQRATIVDYRDFPGHFEKKVQTDPTVALMLSRPSIDRGDFLRAIVVTTWHRTGERPGGVFALSEEQHVWRDKFL